MGSFKNLILIILIFLVVLISGCAKQVVKPVRICPGRETAQEALDALKAQARSIKPFKARGQCLAHFYEQVKDHQKEHKEEFTVRLWLSPPSRFRFWGDIAFNARGLDIGSNENEFWVAAKPKEIGNSFFWGKWSEQGKPGNLKLSPEILLEGFGMIDCNEQALWSLEKQGNSDVLVKKQDDLDSTGSPQVVTKKFYIERCDYRIERVEYFSDQGILTVVELGEYKQFFENMVLPTRIIIKNSLAGAKPSAAQRNDGSEDSFRIVLNDVQPFEATDNNRKIIFGRPEEPKGFEHIYRIVDGKAIEQQ
jgi:hypothetical protein